ncbi:PWI domain-containing protein [Neoconidiobolus thromboides FSU 785]|nr:PWI domain-containing protein [Neoconidiobolus thromboides FSU 785]
MGDAGFFRGTSTTQDSRFSDKEKRLLKTMKFPKCFEKKVEMKKVEMTVIKSWISKRVTEILGFEDEVVIGFIFGLLEEEKVDPKRSQINITGFLEQNAATFMKELWELLLSAQESPNGIPQKFIEEKKQEILNKKVNSELKLDKVFNSLYL